MKKVLKGIYLALIILFLYLPIFTLMVLSFNEGKTMNAWTGFSFRWYREMFSNRTIMEALGNTLTIAFWAAAAATVVGVMACIGLNAMKEKHRSFFMGLNNIPLLNADIVTGISLMLSFLLFGISLNYGTVLFAHITFCIPYVILSVMPRLRATDASLHEAALDLGCTPVKAFFKVILPSISTSIFTGAIMAFTLSLDDFVISYFTCGHYQTLPIVIYNMTKKTVTPDVYALSTIIFLSVFVLLVLYNALQSKSDSRRGINV